MRRTDTRQEARVTETVFTIHSYVRYLVLLAGLGAIVTAIIGWGTAGLPPRAERALSGAFVGLLDLQVVLGVLVLVTGFPFYGALTGHLFMMVLAAAAAHGGSVMARRREPARSGSPMRTIGFALALLLIVGGIMAIQRSII
jgi:heme A synthase